MAQQILEEVGGTEEEDRLSWLHLVCGDAYFGLEQYAQPCPTSSATRVV